MVAPLIAAPLIAWAAPHVVRALKSNFGRQAAGMVAARAADAGTRAGAGALRAVGVNVPPGLEQVVAGLAGGAAGYGAAGGFTRADSSHPTGPGVQGSGGRDNSTSPAGQYDGTGRPNATPQPQPPPNR